MIFPRRCVRCASLSLLSTTAVGTAVFFARFFGGGFAAATGLPVVVAQPGGTHVSILSTTHFHVPASSGGRRASKYSSNCNTD